jgi:hypothetical protein
MIKPYVRLKFKTVYMSMIVKSNFLFQPHVPVRLPCYDFILVTNPKMTILDSNKKFVQ